jgi:hypothetical protein
MNGERPKSEDRHPISRRRMLKRIGAGAAVAWTAPILTSIRTPAFAQSAVCAAGCPACQFGPPCSTCNCVGIPVECFCSNIGVCQAQTPICATDADCVPVTGPGSRCATCVFDPSCVATSCWGPCPGSGRIPRRPGIRVIRASR